MTISVDQLGVESVLIIEVFWGGGSAYLYADKDITAPIGTASGKILQANVISKTGQIGQSGVSKTMSVTLDDTDGKFKVIYDTTRIEGSVCNVYQYIIQDTPTQRLLMTGVISSDIKWLEGERALSFSIEGGTNRAGLSGEIGYAPEENAFVGLNPSAIGRNWPVVCGTAVKVPAVRIEYYDDLKLAENIDYADDAFDITNGSQLPQGITIRLTLDGVIFDGTMAGDTFTPTEKNVEAYGVTAIAPRDGGDPDGTNFSVFWVDPGINLANKYVYLEVDGQYHTNLCTTQIGNKCIFFNSWPKTLDNGDVFESAARYCRTDWTTMFITYAQSGSEYLSTTADGWFIYKDTVVVYDAGTDYMDRYVANLYESSAILAIYGKRNFNGKIIWAKIPQSYYHYHLDEEITTDPGAVTRTCTVIDFPQPLSNYVCENWEKDIWVTLTSTINGNPKDIIDFITTNLTSLSFDATSDDPPVSMNFAYFETTDALEFINSIAYQSASAIQISNGSLRIIFLAQAPGISPNVEHSVDDTLVIMKSLELGFKAKEEINTVHKSKYVIDYSGEKDSSKVYIINQNIEELGVQTREEDLWALTCDKPVKAVTDFWGVKTGNSWKTVKMDCFLDLTSAEVYDAVQFSVDPFVTSGIHGLITSVVHDTDRPCVTLEVETAVKAGTETEDSEYWYFGPATCTPVTDTEEDYTPVLDPSCPSWSIDVGAKTPHKLYEIVMTKWPLKIKRGEAFSIDLELHDSEDVLKAIDVTGIKGKMYTSCITDCFYLPNFNLTGGKVTLTDLKLQKSMFVGRVNFWVKPDDLTIKSGDVREWRPKHI